VRSAALASIVEASTPIRSPLIRTCSARRCSTQVNTWSWTSSGTQLRVRLSQEWSGTRSRSPRRRNSRSDGLSAQPALAVDAFEVADQQHAEVVKRHGVPARDRCDNCLILLRLKGSHDSAHSQRVGVKPRYGPTLRACYPTARLRNRRQTVLRHERQQLERSTLRMLLTALPLADETRGDVQVARKHGLAGTLALT
jgi:hypothetical protein